MSDLRACGAQRLWPIRSFLASMLRGANGGRTVAVSLASVEFAWLLLRLHRCRAEPLDTKRPFVCVVACSYCGASLLDSAAALDKRVDPFVGRHATDGVGPMCLHTRSMPPRVALVLRCRGSASSVRSPGADAQAPGPTTLPRLARQDGIDHGRYWALFVPPTGCLGLRGMRRFPLHLGAHTVPGLKNLPNIVSTCPGHPSGFAVFGEFAHVPEQPA